MMCINNHLNVCQNMNIFSINQEVFMLDILNITPIFPIILLKWGFSHPFSEKRHCGLSIL